jgi:integrase
MRLMAYTFVRTSELIASEWSEFELEAARWDIPAERMKMETPHIVPLSRQSVDFLRAVSRRMFRPAFVEDVTSAREAINPVQEMPRSHNPRPQAA